jgi:polyhydroxyalkanoate synthase subunit PhaC
MMAPPSGPELASQVRDAVTREVERSLLRTRNGIKHVAGIGHARVGLTPKTTVWSRHKAELWRYHSDRVELRPPVLFVFSLLTHSYVLDLRPGFSLIERLRDEGFDVYLLDWGVPDASDAGNTLETYIDDYLPRAIRALVRESDADGVTLFGYCLGATIAAMLVAGHEDLPITNLVCVAAPIDLEIATGVNALFDPTLFNAEEVIDETGNVPPDILRTTFQMLKPTSQAVVYANLWQNLWNDEWVQGYQAMARWTREHIPLPGAVFRQLQELGRLNALVENRMYLGGRKIELASIRCPILNVIAERDHIVPVAASEPLTALSSSADATDLRLPMGHMTLLTGRDAMKKTVPTVIEWMKERST